MDNLMKEMETNLQNTIDRFWETIPPVWNHVKKNVRKIATDEFGVTVEQFHILRHIRKGIGSVSELAEVKMISRSAVSQGVDILVEKKLITRQEDPRDRRFVCLALTPSGNDLLNRIFEKNRAWMSSKMEPLNGEELEAVCKSLELLKRTFCDPD